MYPPQERLDDSSTMTMTVTMAQASAPSVVGQTYHSILETCVHGNSVAVIKRCRDVEDPRTLIRWKNEVACLKIAGTHVREI